MINEEVQLQYAGNNGIALDSAELDRIMDRLAEQNRLTPEQFRARLKADGINEAAFRADLSRRDPRPPA